MISDVRENRSDKIDAIRTHYKQKPGFYSWLMELLLQLNGLHHKRDFRQPPRPS